MLALPRLIYCLFVLARGGLLGHLRRRFALPKWLDALFYVFDVMIARKRPERPGVALAHALQHLGPGFIKLGQVLATRADLMGADSAADLSELQDKLPSFPTREAKAVIAAELGAPIETIFANFEETAIGAASIAQVHLATLHDGRKVAVKVLRPSIRQRIGRDIAFFGDCAHLAESLVPALKKIKLVGVVDQFARITDIELDLRLEAAAATKLASLHADDRCIHIPAVDPSLTTERVMVMERVFGIRIDDKPALLAAGHNIETITRIAARCFFIQVFRDGYFHADMHPGNIFIRDDGVLVPIDFGIMGHLSLPDRVFLMRLLEAMLERDYDSIAYLHKDAGMLGDDVVLEDFADAVRAIAAPVMDKPVAAISLGTMLGQIFSLAHRFEIKVQPQFTLLQKTMVMAEGVSRQLSPSVNMWSLARGFISEGTATSEGAMGQNASIRQLGAFVDEILVAGLRDSA